MLPSGIVWLFCRPVSAKLSSFRYARSLTLQFFDRFEADEGMGVQYCFNIFFFNEIFVISNNLTTLASVQTGTVE